MRSLRAASTIIILFCMDYVIVLYLKCNAAARLVFRAPRCCDITPLLTELHWLNIKHRINFKVIPVTYKAIYGTAAEYIKNLVSLKQNSKYGL